MNKYALATLALVSFVLSAHAKDFGEGWDTKNGPQRVAAAAAYADENGFDCRAFAPRNPTEAQKQESRLMHYSWGVVRIGIHTLCATKKVATIQASAQIARKPHGAPKKPPAVVAEKPKAETPKAPITQPAVAQPVTSARQEAPVAEVSPPVTPNEIVAYRWPQKLFHWRMHRPAS